MNHVYPMRPPRYRTIWISDVHLGSRGCKAAYLLDFLRSTECERLYLGGDIIDLWAMSRSRLYWPQDHNNVIRTILGKAKHDTHVVYVPGNHDEHFRTYDGMVFGNLEIRNSFVHETADGKRLLLLHGDEFDAVIRCSPLIGVIGDIAYGNLLRLNHLVHQVRKRFGMPYFSVAAHLKHRVKNAVNMISRFEEALSREARRRGVDGIVCGHIHHAEIREVGGVLYCNSGDWVESCTALVEDLDGRLQILHWSDQSFSVKSADAIDAARLSA